MISYFVYFLVFLILCFVFYLAVKATARGLEAKNKNKKFTNKLNNLKYKKNNK